MTDDRIGRAYRAALAAGLDDLSARRKALEAASGPEIPTIPGISVTVPRKPALERVTALGDALMGPGTSPRLSTDPVTGRPKLSPGRATLPWTANAPQHGFRGPSQETVSLEGPGGAVVDVVRPRERAPLPPTLQERLATGAGKVVSAAPLAVSAGMSKVLEAAGAPKTASIFQRSAEVMADDPTALLHRAVDPGKRFLGSSAVMGLTALEGTPRILEEAGVPGAKAMADLPMKGRQEIQRRMGPPKDVPETVADVAAMIGTYALPGAGARTLAAGLGRGLLTSVPIGAAEREWSVFAQPWAQKALKGTYNKLMSPALGAPEGMQIDTPEREAAADAWIEKKLESPFWRGVGEAAFDVATVGGVAGAAMGAAKGLRGMKEGAGVVSRAGRRFGDMLAGAPAPRTETVLPPVDIPAMGAYEAERVRRVTETDRFVDPWKSRFAEEGGAVVNPLASDRVPGQVETGMPGKWISTFRRAVEEGPGKAKGKFWNDYLVPEKRGFKAGELEWAKLDLDPEAVYTKDDILQRMRPVKLEEAVLSTAGKEARDLAEQARSEAQHLADRIASRAGTMWADVADAPPSPMSVLGKVWRGEIDADAGRELLAKGLPGGSLPPSIEMDYTDFAMRVGRARSLPPVGRAPRYGRIAVPGGENYREVLVKFGPEDANAPKYEHQHWPDDVNVQGHLRLTDRTINGEKALFVEEMQSDIAQQARNRAVIEAGGEEAWKGIPESEKKGLVRAQFGKEAQEKAWSVRDDFDDVIAGPFTDRDEAVEALRAAQEGGVGNGLHITTRSPESYIPDAPYKDTESWVGLLTRRALQEAVNGGYDRLVLPTGRQVAEAEGLAKHLDAIHYDPKTKMLTAEKDGELLIRETMPEEKLPDFLGKNVAAKLLESPIAEEGYATGRHVLTKADMEDDIVLGTQKMEAFYDRIVPNIVKREARALGVRAELEPIEGVGLAGDVSRNLSIRITPELAETVKTKGTRLYSAVGPALGAVGGAQVGDTPEERARNMALGLAAGTLGAGGIGKAAEIGLDLGSWWAKRTGKSLEEWEKLGALGQAYEFRKALSGKVFGATFVKKDGTVRTGSFRLGVKSGLKPVEEGVERVPRKYDPDTVGNLVVFDMNKGQYRTIKIESIKEIKLPGEPPLVPSKLSDEGGFAWFPGAKKKGVESRPGVTPVKPANMDEVERLRGMGLTRAPAMFDRETETLFLGPTHAQITNNEAFRVPQRAEPGWLDLENLEFRDRDAASGLLKPGERDPRSAGPLRTEYLKNQEQVPFVRLSAQGDEIETALASKKPRVALNAVADRYGLKQKDMSELLGMEPTDPGFDTAYAEFLRKQAQSPEAPRTPNIQGQYKRPGWMKASREKLIDLALRGVRGKNWYAEGRQAFEQAVGKEAAPAFAEFQAPFSMNEGPRNNFIQALDNWWRTREGRPVSGAMGGKKDKVRLLSESGELDTPKVWSYARNLQGDENQVTIDTWMWRALEDMEPQASPLKTADSVGLRYAQAREEIREIAQELTKRTGETWTPAQVQAAMWVEYRDEWMKALGKQAPGNSSFVDMFNDVMRVVNVGQDVKGAALPFRELEATNIVGEMVPSRASKRLPGIQDAPLALRKEYSDARLAAVRPVLVDLYEQLGLDPGKVSAVADPMSKAVSKPGTTGLGGTWESKWNSNVRITLPERTSDGREVPDWMKRVYAAVVGDALEQDAVPWITYRHNDVGALRQIENLEGEALEKALADRGIRGKIGGVQIVTREHLKPEVAEKLAAHLQETAPGVNFSQQGDVLTFGDFSGSGQSPKKFWDQVIDALDSYDGFWGDLAHPDDVVYARFDGDLIGEAYDGQQWQRVLEGALEGAEGDPLRGRVAPDLLASNRNRTRSNLDAVDLGFRRKLKRSSKGGFALPELAPLARVAAGGVAGSILASGEGGVSPLEGAVIGAGGAALSKMTAPRLVALWRSGLLSNPSTHIANLVGNTSMLISEVAKDAPAAGFDALLVKLAERFGQKLPRTKAGVSGMTVKATGKGLGEGAEKAIEAMRTGETDTLAKWDIDEQVNFDDLPLGSVLNVYAGPRGIISRSLAAGDQLFKRSALKRSIMERAVVAAKNEGLKGEALVARAKQLAESDEGIHLAAITDAEVSVFQNEGRLSKALSGLRKPLGAAGELLIPFSRTPANIAERVAEYTPMGLLLNYNDFTKWMGKVKKAGALTAEDIAEIGLLQRKMADRTGRAVTGSLLIGAGWMLSDMGLVSDEADSPQERAARETTGTGSKALRVGDTWLGLERTSPVGNLIGLGADMRKAFAKDGAVAAMEEVPGAVFRTSPLRGVQSAMDAVAGQYGSVSDYASDFAPSVIPAVVGAAARAIDPVTRAPGSSLQRVRSRVPFLSRTVPARIDILGDEIKKAPSLIGRASNVFSPFAMTESRTSDPVRAELERLGVVIGSPAPSGLEPGTLEYEAALREYGRATRTAIEREMLKPKYKKASDEDKAVALKKAVSSARTKVTEKRKKKK